MANSVLPLSVGPIKTITLGGWESLLISEEEYISYIIKVIKFFIDCEPFSFCNGKFNERTFKKYHY